MELNVANVFSEDLLQKGCKLYYGSTETLKKLGDFENYIYEVKVEGESRILRFVHSSHRSHELIEAEVEWVEYLYKNGASVYRHFVSANGCLIEPLEAADGTVFYVSSFEKLPGRQIAWKEVEKNLKIAYSWGKSLGLLNRLSKTYNNVKCFRPQWDEEELFDIEQYKPDITKHILNYRDEILLQISTLPKNSDTYGLIHSDLHHGNFLYDQGRIHIFDFDDSAYHWFASDIAMPLYYIVMQRDFTTKETRQEFIHAFITSFLEGYSTENILPEKLAESIPLFLKLRDVVLLSVLYKKFDFEKLDDHDRLFFNTVKDRVDRKETIVTFDKEVIKNIR
ncbi:phosphotransferase enzyme family protein [Peribacillus deserti]|uniref:Aminoglycoside phosphotransferase domain-containing protein n=1 Tax=Peribacillus deserti TaxID=673318 RepID=A0A2N5M2C4_9BACI|nr:phosphotransferase [Peribacillus deserti]PLT28518.1 hypothetical protein CUU66_18135 [Peribacillus deserti]